MYGLIAKRVKSNLEKAIKSKNADRIHAATQVYMDHMAAVAEDTVFAAKEKDTGPIFEAVFWLIDRGHIEHAIAIRSGIARLAEDEKIYPETRDSLRRIAIRLERRPALISESGQPLLALEM